MPPVDGGVVLHAGVAADVGRLGNHPHQVARLVRLHRFTRRDRARDPIAVVRDRLHEFVGHAHAVIRILEKDRRIRFAVNPSGIAVVQQDPGFLFLAGFAVDEFHNVGMAGIQNDHFCRAPRLAPGLDDARECIETFHKRHRSGRDTSAGKLFL